MADVTAVLNRYREACRVLWNNFLRDPDARGVSLSDERYCHFNSVRDILFTAMVLTEIGHEDFTPRFGWIDTGPIPFLRVAARANAAIMVNRELPHVGNQYWDGPVTRVPERIELHFIDYFDWDKAGYRDFAYYHVRIVACREHPEIIGRDALLEVLSGGVFAER